MLVNLSSWIVVLCLFSSNAVLAREAKFTDSFNIADILHRSINGENEIRRIAPGKVIFAPETKEDYSVPGAIIFQSPSTVNTTALNAVKQSNKDNIQFPSKTVITPLNPVSDKVAIAKPSPPTPFQSPLFSSPVNDDNDRILSTGQAEASNQQKLPEGTVIFAPQSSSSEQKNPIAPVNSQGSDGGTQATNNSIPSAESGIEISDNGKKSGPTVIKPQARNSRSKKVKALEKDAIESLEFELGYNGPRIDLHSNITIPFVKDTLIPFFKSGGLLDRKSAFSLFYRAFLEFSDEETLEDIYLEADDTLVVFGDIHGQMHDFLQVFDHEGYPRADLKYLFNGDIVDRGANSVECLLILLALKVAEPDLVFITLGNHETLTVGKLQFYKESVKKYGSDEFFRLAHKLFRSLPVSFLVEDEVFITHGGLSPFLKLDRVRSIDRLDPSYEDIDIINDLTWSDPVEQNGLFESQRGLGYLFGPDITKDFLQFNNISAIIRSHQYKEVGYSEEHDNLCITVFSCPNYRGNMKNLGAYLRINKNLDMEVKNFVAASTVEKMESPVLAVPRLVRNLKRDKSKKLEISAPTK